MSATTFRRDARVYVTHPTPWAGRVGTVVRDEADSLGRVRVMLDGDDDGTGKNWVAIEAEYLIPSFEASEVFGDPSDTPQDHGPLAAPLSDRTLAKVLSRPAHVPRETPSLVELDRREAAADVRSNHTVTIDYGTGAPFPTLSFRCTAPAGDLCHAYYECSCEEWGQEGVIHGKPWHVDHEDVNHFGYWRNEECRLQDWFESSDEAVVGSVSIPVAVKYTGGWYEFDITAVQS